MSINSATRIQTQDQSLSSTSSVGWGANNNLSVSVKASAEQRPGLANDASADYFINRAMDFGHESRAGCEDAFFGAFAPQCGRSPSLDIRVSIGINPAAPSHCRPAPPPMPQPPRAPSNPTNATTSMKDGKATFENDNYTITAGDNDTVTITNKRTGSVYEAWGDPHMKINGQHAFDFYGQTTIELEDGTKVTIGTTDADEKTTLSSKLTITNGDYGAQIIGIDSTKSGDLAIKEFQGQGEALDAAVDDGVSLDENAAGNDLVTTDQNGVETDVDQAYINLVDEKLTQGKRSENVGQFDELGPDWGELLYADAAVSDWIFGGQPGAGGFDAFSYGNNGSLGTFLSSLSSLGAVGGSGSSFGSTASKSWWMDPSFFDRKLKDEIPVQRPTRSAAKRPPPQVDLQLNTRGNGSMAMNLVVDAARRTSTDISLRVWG
jgi:Domain of Unknown Function (DUF1521)